MNRKVVILGGVGNATVVAAAIEHALRMGATYLEVAGFLNDREPVGKQLDMLQRVLLVQLDLQDLVV